MERTVPCLYVDADGNTWAPSTPGTITMANTTDANKPPAFPFRKYVYVGDIGRDGMVADLGLQS